MTKAARGLLLTIRLGTFDWEGKHTKGERENECQRKSAWPTCVAEKCVFPMKVAGAAILGPSLVRLRSIHLQKVNEHFELFADANGLKRYGSLEASVCERTALKSPRVVRWVHEVMRAGGNQTH